MEGKHIVALYPGTFDPVTYGHLDIAERCMRIFDRLLIAIAINPWKEPLFDVEERLEMLRLVTQDLPGVEVDSFDTLTVSYARRVGAQVIVRGLRAVSDFEEEFKMASANRKLADEINTVLMLPSEKYFYLNSGLVKEIARLGGPVNCFVPPPVEERLREKLASGEY
ncbi:MAG: pantetheine-phosphate adenylyltransferase [Candidatus Coatesbacteria bacterium]|nr:MAG: pantetheine-phosphate adenylyltransferase [Candidatus Coatesbacteria bacterium]